MKVKKTIFAISSVLIILLYTNFTSLDTFAHLMPKSTATSNQLLEMYNDYFNKFVAATPEPHRVPNVNEVKDQFSSRQDVKTLVAKFRESFIDEMNSLKIGIEVSVVPGSDILILQKSSGPDTSNLANALGAVKQNFKQSVKFDPSDFFGRSSNNNGLEVKDGNKISVYLGWLGIRNCSILANGCAVDVILHEIWGHLQPDMDLISGIANGLHGQVAPGKMEALALNATKTKNKDGEFVKDYDDGSGYDKNATGWHFSEAYAHSLEVFAGLGHLSEYMKTGGPGLYTITMEFRSAYTRAVMMVSALKATLKEYKGSSVYSRDFKTKSIRFCFDKDCIANIEAAGYYLDGNMDLVTPKGKVAIPRDGIGRPTAQGEQIIDQVLKRQIDRSEGTFVDLEQRLENAKNKFTNNLDQLVSEKTISSDVAKAIMRPIRAADKVVSNSKTKYPTKYPTTISEGAKPFVKESQKSTMGWNQRNKLLANGAIDPSKSKKAGPPSGNSQGTVVVQVSKNSSAGKKVDKANADKPDSYGQDVIAANEKTSKEVLADIGVSVAVGQPVVVTNGSVLLSYDYGWYDGGTGETPDFIFDSTQYVTERLCPSCYNFNFPPIASYADAMELVANVSQDFYNQNAGGINIIPKDPIEGIGNTISVGDIVGKRTAVFTEAALINEAAKNGSVSKQELNDRLTNLAEQNEKLKILLGFLDDVISGKTLVDFIDGAVDKAGDIKKTPGLDSTGNLAIKQIMNSTSAILGDEGKSPSMDVNLGVPGQQGIQASENAPSTSGTTALDQTLAQAQANATPTVDSFPDQATTASAYVSLITAGNNSVPTLAGVDSATGAVAIAVPKTTTDVTNMAAAIAENTKKANDAIKNAANSQVAAQAALDAVNKANTANAAMTKAINDKATADAPKATNVKNTVEEEVSVDVPYCSYGGAEGPCSTANSSEDARIAVAVEKAKSYLDSNYKLLVKTDFFPVLYDRGGTYVEGGCDGEMGPILSNGNGGGSIRNCTRSGTGKTPKGLTAGEFNKAQAYRQQVRDNFIAANTPVRASIMQTKVVPQKVKTSKDVFTTIPAVAPILISYSAIDTTGITNKINDFGQQAAAQALKDANVFTTAMASSGCDMICQFFKLPQNPLSSNMTLEQAKNIIANTSGSNSVSSVEVQNSLISSYYTKDGLFKDGGTQINQFPAITIDYSNSCK